MTPAPIETCSLTLAAIPMYPPCPTRTCPPIAAPDVAQQLGDVPARARRHGRGLVDTAEKLGERPVFVEELGGIVHAVRLLAGPDTVVVSLQNGMNPPAIAARLGAGRVVGAFVSFPADWQGPGHIEQGGFGNIWIGEMDGRISERLPRIQRLLAYSVNAHITSNIVGYLWSKQVDCSLLFAQAVGDATFADTFSNARYQPLLVALVGEGVGAALAAGVKLESFGAFEPLKMRPRTANEEAEARAVLDRFADSTRSQVKVRSGPWRDLAVRKRPTEVDHMVGWVIDEGRRRGVAMPLNQQLVQQVKELEQERRSRGLHNLDELEALRAKLYPSSMGPH